MWWWWATQESMDTHQETPENDSHESQTGKIEHIKKPEWVLPPVKKRKRKVHLPNIEKNLRKILYAANNGEYLIFKGAGKTTRGLHRGKSKRRSRYIGVLTNNKRWQSLINVGPTKRYIGTFCTEEQAALSYDFYAIGMHLKKANINFTYTAENLKPLIEDYLASSNWFEPSKFI